MRIALEMIDRGWCSDFSSAQPLSLFHQWGWTVTGLYGQLQVSIGERILTSMCRPCCHRPFLAYEIALLFNSGLDSLMHWHCRNNLFLVKNETLLTSLTYKHQFSSGEVSGPLFLYLARFQNYCRTGSHSVEPSFDCYSFLRVTLFVCSTESGMMCDSLGVICSHT